METLRKSGFRPNWLPNASLRRTNPSASRTQLTPSTLRGPVRLVCGLTLVLLGTLLIGCTTLPTPLLREPKPVTKPVLSQPLPSETYSKGVQTNIESWEKSLTGTSPTSKP